jgi:lysophospholipase L1-like esterase
MKWIVSLFRLARVQNNLEKSTRNRRPRYARRPSVQRLLLELLEDRNLLSATIRVGVMGDSLSAPYAGQPYGAAGDQNWVELLRTLRPENVTIYDEAVPGATSSSLLDGGQQTAVASLIARHKVDFAVLIVGANDITQNLPSIFAGDPTPFVHTVVANIKTALKEVAAGGDAGLVVGNIPDITVTPAFRTFVTSNPVLLEEVTNAVSMANTQIEQFAAAHGVPVLDLFALSHLTGNPIPMGGVQVRNLYAPDEFHPGTVVQGLFANAFLQALEHSDDVHIHRLRLSDQDILTQAGIPHPHLHTFFDVNSLVIISGCFDPDHGRFLFDVFVDLRDHVPDLTSYRSTRRESSFASPTRPAHQPARSHGQVSRTTIIQDLFIEVGIGSPNDVFSHDLGLGLLE